MDLVERDIEKLVQEMVELKEIIKSFMHGSQAKLGFFGFGVSTSFGKNLNLYLTSIW